MFESNDDTAPQSLFGGGGGFKFVNQKENQYVFNKNWYTLEAKALFEKVPFCVAKVVLNDITDKVNKYQ